MSSAASLHIIQSSEAEARLREAERWLTARADRGALVVSASRGAADDLARRVALSRGATAGLHRFSFAQLAARLAAPVLAAQGIAPATLIGSEAVAARVTFDARHDDHDGDVGLAYFGVVAGTPGFPRALARTLHDLAMAGVEAPALRELPLGGSDLARLLDAFDEQFAAASAIGRAALFTAACEGAAAVARLPLLLLDVPMESEVELALARQLIAAAPDTLITVPFGDLATLDYLETLGVPIETLVPAGDSDLAALRRSLFAARQPPERVPHGDVRLFSAPGEGRECVEIARRILDEAQRGVRFDEMAVFLRSPREYLGLVENAFERAGINAWFDRGARRPHPSGRAFLAILGCAVERLSAVRFAEYLSLAQVPDIVTAETEVLPPADDVVSGFMGISADEPEDSARGPSEARPASAEATAVRRSLGEGGSRRASASGGGAPRALIDADGVANHRSQDAIDHDESPIVEGRLRAPWKWERLIVEASVVGGDPERWRRRLRGLREGYEARIKEERRREDPESPKLAGLERDRQNLAHLSAFALPIVETLASWPSQATWGEWIERFGDLAPRVLRRPARVSRVLGELRAMSAIGPVTLEEARDVLAERLRTFDEQPPADRYGRVFVGSPHQARGRAFKVVFVPGLAERLFPQKLHEDPLLLDLEMRQPLAARLGTHLVVQDDRARTERLLLRLAVGAATDRLWLSYPRLDVGGARPRVPSFYVLDVMRAIVGQIPHHEELQRDAALAGGATLDWPAPADPADAIDEVEHDLATLRMLFGATDRATVRGHAHYLLGLNPALRRSVTRRWVRARSRWLAQDGLVRITPAIKPMLDSQRLGARPYSVSALQKFTTCPYQFVLAAIYRFAPNDPPEPLQRLDPLTRGSLFHEVQASVLRTLHAANRLPLSVDGVPNALAALAVALERTASAYKERLAPAIERVWHDEIAALGRDLRVWIRKLPEAAPWTPEYFEYSFGLADEGRDARSQRDPVRIDGRFILRGSVDMIETRTGSPELRITDHKTGRNRTTPRTVIGGGGTLQPVIYGLAIEKIMDRPVREGRLFYATTAGGFAEHPVPLSDANRRAGLEALEIIDRAIELGFLPAAPAERACSWCDFRAICGPDEPRHAARKAADPLADLTALREMP
jgi:ATP-dependent helicase/nuclease subunit B